MNTMDTLDRKISATQKKVSATQKKIAEWDEIIRKLKIIDKALNK